MIDIDKWQEIWQTLTRRKLRTLLTSFGVFWGIFMLVLLLGAGEGLEQAATGKITFARNSIFIWGSITSMPYQGFEAGRPVQFTNEDYEAFRNMGAIGVVSPIVNPGSTDSWGTARISHQRREVSFDMLGVYPQALTVNPLRIDTGRYINQLDINHNRKVVVLGRRVKEELFGEAPALGSYVRVNSVPFLVVGVFASLGSGEQARNDIQNFHLPATTAQQTFNLGNRIQAFGFIPAPGYDSTHVQQLIADVIRKRHHIDPRDKQAFFSWNTEQSFREIESIFNGIASFSWLVALGTLFAGMVGVANIMLITVKERTKEFGIRKSVGAHPWSIITMLVQETLVITFVAGYLGLLFGVLTIEGIAVMMQALNIQSDTFAKPAIDFQAAFSAILVLTLSGILAGLIPGIKAMRVDPVIALRDM